LDLGVTNDGVLLKRMAHEADRIQEGEKRYSLGYDWRNLP
jgi:hypothetical protein